MRFTALLFDLDGVLVDTAKYHYIAWKALAEELGIPFTLKDNERLKGVSRQRSLDIVLEIGGVDKSPEEREALCTEKNQRYLSYIRKMEPEEILPGVRDFLTEARRQGYKIALGSASKNARLILDRLELTGLFDAIVDGYMVTQAKPAPEVFALGGRLLSAQPGQCLVFEDSVAGIQAAHAGGMTAVGIGTREDLPEADLVLPGFAGVTMEEIENKLLALGF